jgi:hypothetical protein
LNVPSRRQQVDRTLRVRIDRDDPTRIFDVAASPMLTPYAGVLPQGPFAPAALATVVAQRIAFAVMRDVFSAACRIVAPSGKIAFDRVVLQIASVHRLEGSAIETATPIGYIFEHEGVPAGSVELNGRPEVRFARGSDAPTRRAVMIAATALGVLWDPADSTLGREAE